MNTIFMKYFLDLKQLRLNVYEDLAWVSKIKSWVHVPRNFLRCILLSRPRSDTSVRRYSSWKKTRKDILPVVCKQIDSGICISAQRKLLLNGSVRAHRNRKRTSPVTGEVCIWNTFVWRKDTRPTAVCVTHLSAHCFCEVWSYLHRCLSQRLYISVLRNGFQSHSYDLWKLRTCSSHLLPIGKFRVALFCRHINYADDNVIGYLLRSSFTRLSLSHCEDESISVEGLVEHTACCCLEGTLLKSRSFNAGNTFVLFDTLIFHFKMKKKGSANRLLA